MSMHIFSSSLYDKNFIFLWLKLICYFFIFFQLRPKFIELMVLTDEHTGMLIRLWTGVYKWMLNKCVWINTLYWMSYIFQKKILRYFSLEQVLCFLQITVVTLLPSRQVSPHVSSQSMLPEFCLLSTLYELLFLIDH